MSATPPLHVVTGVAGYTGRHVARLLLERGDRVRSLTGHPERPDPFGGRVPAVPFDFDRPDRLAGHLAGADTLFNTYWVRFDHGATTFDLAIRNTRTLFAAARAAGVRRVVHVSITNPREDSPLPYFRGKACLERELQQSGVSWAILRPAVLFGGERDVLINNIAWCLRRFPAFLIPGSGRYGLRPIHVEDLAAAMVALGAGDDRRIVDAVGPEAYTYEALVWLVADALGRQPVVVHVPPGAALAGARAVGWLVGDVLLTRDEVTGLMAGLLESDAPAAGARSLREWVGRHAASFGHAYASELARHYR